MSEMNYIKQILKRRMIAVTLITLAVAVGPAFTARTRTEVEARARGVTIYRDSFGVPHVFARTDADCVFGFAYAQAEDCLLYTSPSPRDRQKSRMPSSA